MMTKSTFMFLTNLAYKNRLTIPIFVTIAFLVCNFRWEIVGSFLIFILSYFRNLKFFQEISIQTERIQLQANNTDNDDDIEELSTNGSDDEYEPVTDDDLTEPDSNDEMI